MTWIEVIEPKAAEGALRAAYGEVESARGVVANVFKAQSLHPEALVAHVRLHMSLLQGDGGLSRRERELIGLVVSRETRCGYMFAHQADAFSRHVVEPGLVALVAADPEKAPLPERERSIAAFAAEMTRRPGVVTEGHLDELRSRGLGEREVLDVVLLSSYFNYITRVANGLGVTTEDVALPYKY